MKLLLLCLFVFSFITGAQAQNPTLDSLIARLDNIRQSDTNKVALLNKIGLDICGFSPQKARSYSEQGLKLATQLKYTKGMADAYRGISYSYYAQTDNDKSMHFALLAMKEYEKKNLLEGVSWSYGMIGLSYLLGLNLDKAEHYFRLSLALNEKINNKPGLAKDLNNIGLIGESRKDYKTALQYYQKALAIWEEQGNTQKRTLAYNNVGSIYIFLENYPLAMQYLEKALRLAQQTQDKDHIALIHQNLGELCYKTGRYKEGEAYLKTSLHIAAEIGNKKRIEQTYDALSSLEASRKNYEAAFHYLKSAGLIRDSLYTEERYRQVTELETRYETQKKEQEIELLERNTQIQTLWRNSLIVVLALTVVAAVIIFLLQRSRTLKARELLDVQQLMNRKMQEMDKVKSYFFANISHEFRTPLTLIITPIEEKLHTEGLSQKDRIAFQTVRRSANRLLELINQLLELSKLEAGYMQLHTQPGNLYNFIMPVVSAFDSLADVNQLEYTRQISIPTQGVLFDGDKLEKILTNLLSNAFKFSVTGGRVAVSAQAEERDKTLVLTIEVRNQGPVIPPDTLERIFTPFFQGESTPLYGAPGTGLGLSLVKELVKLHQGDITVSSDAVNGTVFSVLLSFEKSDALPHTIEPAGKVEKVADSLMEEASVQADTAKETILIIEDNNDVRALIRRSLEDQYNIQEAATGREGFEMAIDQTIDLVVSDVMMPVMNGVELCNLLKNDQRTSHIPIILLTARADLESKLEGLRTGADDYVVKPFNMQELQARIANLVERRKKLIRKYQQRVVVQPHEITVTTLDERFLQKATRLVEDNLDNIEFTVDRMALELGMSRSNLLRKLKSITGLSSNEFIQDFRLRRAAQLIENKADTISQIAYQVGFYDQSYFSKCFKKKFGKTPTEYAAVSQD